VASFVGCGKSEDGAGVLAREDLPARFADIYCRSLEVCCGEQALSFDPTECRRISALELEGNLSDFDWSKTGYDARAAGDCMALYAEADDCRGDVLEDAEVCNRVIFGLLAPGQPCDSSNECKEGPGERASCYGPADGTSVCRLSKSVALSRGKQGAACQTTCDVGDSCTESVEAPLAGEPTQPPQPGDSVACFRTDNLHCSYATGTCEPLVALGQPCFGDDSCAGDAFCAFDAGICMAARAPGEACRSSSECGAIGCIFAEDADEGTCGTRVVSQRECSMYFND
jgi:hypothetical protein